MDDLLSTLLHLKSVPTSITKTRTSDKSCFSAAVQNVWARDPGIAGELLEELTKQGRSRWATLGKAAEPWASSDDQTPAIPYEATATTDYINVGTQTAADVNNAVESRARRRRHDDLLYRPSHSAYKHTVSRQTQRNDADNEPPTSQRELPSLKPPDVEDVSNSCGIRYEAETSPCPSIVDFVACDERTAARKSSLPSLGLAQHWPHLVDRDLRDGAQERGATETSMATPESPVMLDTSSESKKDLIMAPRDKATAAQSPALATCLFLVSEDTVRCMIFNAARDIHDMEMYEGRLGGELHRGILNSLKCDHSDEVISRPAGSIWAASRPIGWSLTMWMNILDQGRASHKKSGILRKIEWMGASEWFDYQTEQALKAPPRTKRGIPVKRVSTAVLDRMLNEALHDDSDTPSEQHIDRKAQQRKTFIDICNRGKRLRQIVKVLGTGVLFYRRIWDLMKISQNQVEAVVSHISTDPSKATIFVLLGEQVELLVGSGRPNTATFLDGVDANQLVSAGDASSLRLDYDVQQNPFLKAVSEC
ncbi:uncharacterized protein J7T55_012005 [Diaporthe amygdali]|uniref:uncharacterized protein n=1 Tax=Phomopsis amygdali TaxID=1214568 RepID=UPI0022FEDC58|nr:uncharacterized protein J7T55_012005 [Diaporthe amygdali]KAJ0123540.1 uncharacterized protein J7T55_012005 [Diaporthe amygdali]